MTRKMPFLHPPVSLRSNIGLAQQCWHMAHAACYALEIEFDEASPSEIFEMIDNLRRGQASNNIRTIHEAAVCGKNIELDHVTGLMSLVDKESQTIADELIGNYPFGSSR